VKITKIKTYKFSVPTGQNVCDPHTGERLSSSAKPWLFLKLETDVGVDGWGEASGEWLTPSVEATLHDWSRLLVGQDPTQVVALSEDIANRLPWKGGPVFGAAIAAINMALYDIAGKAWGVPVHTILGGKRRNRVRVYSNGGTFASPSEAVESAQKVAAAGYAGVKANPLETRTWPCDEEAIELSVACVAAIREAMGSHFDILLDTHGSPTPEFALAFAHRVAPYRPLFLEEPIKVGSVEALMEVSRKSPIPIATGEKIFTLRDFKPLIDQRACAYLQPDVKHCFGITTLVAIAQRAEENQMLMAPHNVGGPITHAATLHADAVMNNFLIQETTQVFFEQYTRYAEHDWAIKDGYINISDAPGLGVQVKEADLAKLPYEPLAYRQYHHADGSWKGW
jgi:galactonate dehydratase